MLLDTVLMPYDYAAVTAFKIGGTDDNEACRGSSG
jgi:hypothetical protein